jgi:hypothetical protein
MSRANFEVGAGPSRRAFRHFGRSHEHRQLLASRKERQGGYFGANRIDRWYFSGSALRENRKKRRRQTAPTVPEWIFISHYCQAPLPNLRRNRNLVFRRFGELGA